MAAVSLQVLLTVILRLARQQPDPRAWLTERLTEAGEALLKGDTHVTSTAFKGQSATEFRGLTASELASLCDQALAQLEAEADTDSTIQLPGGAYFANAFTRV